MTKRCMIPELAKQIGLVEALFIDHLNYWMQKGKDKYKDKNGNAWFHTTYKDIIEKGGIISPLIKIRRMIKYLETEQIIFSQRPIKNKEKRYQLNYSHTIIKEYYSNPQCSVEQTNSSYEQTTVLNRADQQLNRADPNINNKHTIKKTRKHTKSGDLDFSSKLQKEQEQKKNQISNATDIKGAVRDPYSDYDPDAITPAYSKSAKVEEISYYGDWKYKELKNFIKEKSLDETDPDTMALWRKRCRESAMYCINTGRVPRNLLEKLYLSDLQKIFDKITLSENQKIQQIGW